MRVKDGAKTGIYPQHPIGVMWEGAGGDELWGVRGAVGGEERWARVRAHPISWEIMIGNGGEFSEVR